MYEPEFLYDSLNKGWSLSVLGLDEFIIDNIEKELIVIPRAPFKPLNFRVHESCCNDFYILDISSAGQSVMVTPEPVHAFCFSLDYEIEKFGIKYKTINEGQVFKIVIKKHSYMNSHFRAALSGVSKL